MRADDVKEIKSRVHRSDARDMRAFVIERSLWRLLWPLILIAATLLNIVFAGDYLATIAPPDESAPILFGLNRGELINWTCAVVLIGSGRVLMVMLSENGIGGFEGFRVRAFLRVMLGCLIFFSVYTAAQGVSVGLQKTMDHGAATSTAYHSAQEATGAERDGVAGAERALTGARIAVEDARRDWNKYKADADAMSAGDRAWLMRPTATAPYMAAIERAESGVTAARSDVDAARSRLSAALSRQGEAVSTGGAEKTQLEQVGAVIPDWMGGPWSAEFVAWAFGLFCAVLLELICYAGQAGSACTLKTLMAGTLTADDIRGAAKEGIAADDSNVVQLSARARHADRIASAIDDARNGDLTSASFPTLKARYGGGDEAATLIRQEFVSKGLAVESGGGRVELIAI